MNLLQLLRDAFDDARNDPALSAAAIDRLNVHRSRAWVGALSRQFSKQCEGEVCVFSKHDQSNRERFGLNELLYDICVCRTATCTSPVHGKTLHYIQRALWQVESEFAADTQQTMYDFNKLVLGSAEQKMLIVPCTPKPENYLNTLCDVAGWCSGKVYVGFIPPPDRWDAGAGEVRCYEYVRPGWGELRQ